MLWRFEDYSSLAEKVMADDQLLANCSVLVEVLVRVAGLEGMCLETWVVSPKALA